MKILAIDPSLNETGWYYGDKFSRESGIIKPKYNNDIERLQYIENYVKMLLNKYVPEIVIYEDYSFGSRGRATFSLGELGGILKLLFCKQNIKLVVIGSGQWKKFILGKGNLKKDQVMMMVLKKFNEEFTNNNICDAFCLYKFGEAYAKYITGDRNFKKYELEVLKNIVCNDIERGEKSEKIYK